VFDMYIVLAGCAQQGSAAPLAASVDVPSLVDMVDVIGPETGSVVTFTTVVGEIDATVVATGGDGNYTYSWTVSKVSENSDNGNRFSVASTGTTNAARYNTLTINGSRPGSRHDPPHDSTFLARCNVQDGAGGNVNVDINLIVNGITIP
tara:strand:+ start:2870 stop:3316 length:447 start_codon:yes stop_codon:yes gene_type:complete